MTEDCFAPQLGHKDIQAQLVHSFRRNRFPHALLFHGPEGAGKDAIAIAIAQMLNCESAEQLRCGQCPSCRKIARLQHPDVKMIFPTPAESNVKDPELQSAMEAKAANPYRRIAFEGKNVFIGIDTIRELKQEARFKLFEGKKKVYIITNAEQMRPEAANALLKVLEEPPDNLMLILTTSQIHKILPTIRSRCQLVAFPPLSEPEIREIVRTYHPELSGKDLSLLVRLSGFNTKRLFEFLDTDYLQKREQALEFLRKLVRLRRGQELMQVIETLTRGRDRDEVRHLLWFLLLWFQDALHLQKQGEAAAICNQDLKKNLQEFLSFAPAADIGEIVWELENAYQEVEDPRNLNPVLILTTLAIKINKFIIK